MKAWQVLSSDSGVVLNDIEQPTPGFSDVIIEVKAAGLCHSDVAFADEPSYLPQLGELPRTLGHEIAGNIAELGAGAAKYWSVGDRVAVCTRDDYEGPGIELDGGFQPYVRVPARQLVRVPEAVDWAHAAIATDAGTTSHNTVVNVAAPGPGTRIGILGLGGLGHFGAAFSVLSGAEVYVADPRESVWQQAQQLGIDQVAASITDFTDEQLDVIVDFAGTGASTQEAIQAIRPGGRIIQVGIAAPSHEIDLAALVFKDITLRGVRYGFKRDLEQVLRHFARGDLNPVVQRIGFDDIGAGIDRLRNGTATGRQVAIY